MRLLVFGSRTWTDKDAIERAIKSLKPSVVIEGDARGADRLAGYVAVALGIPVEHYPVDNAIDGPWPAAGHRRNERMHRLGKPDRAVGFVSGKLLSPLSKGSAGMAQICRRAKTPLSIFRDNGRES